MLRVYERLIESSVELGVYDGSVDDFGEKFGSHQSGSPRHLKFDVAHVYLESLKSKRTSPQLQLQLLVFLSCSLTIFTLTGQEESQLTTPSWMLDLLRHRLAEDDGGCVSGISRTLR